MTERSPNDPVLTRFRAAVTEIYGERVERAVLYARGRAASTGRSPITTSMFARVAKADPRVDRTLASLLGRAYKFKEVADYGVGSHAVVTAKEAQDLIDIAQRFVDTITQLLQPSLNPPRGPHAQP